MALEIDGWKIIIFVAKGNRVVWLVGDKVQTFVRYHDGSMGLAYLPT